MLGGSIRPASISPGVGGEIRVASTSRGRSSRAPPIRRRVGSMASISGEGSGADVDAAPASRRSRREEDTVNLFRNYELRTAFAPQERRRLPTTLVTGWLGSGKTTVMRHVLANRQDLRVACVVNDFAELNIDAELVARDDNGVMPGVGAGKNVEGVVELTNGCLCCTLGGELETEVWRMLDDSSHRRDDGGHVGDVDYLLIETSGLVDPTETVASLDKTFGKMARVRLDTVVCVVDAEAACYGAAGFLLDGPEAWSKQLSVADVVLLNKVDLLDGSEKKLAKAHEFVGKYAPDARVVECTRGKAPLQSILDVQPAPQPEGKFGHDWDSAVRPFLVSSTGEGLRKPGTRPKPSPSGPFVIDPTKRTSHNRGKESSAVANDDFGSVSFEGGALSLASFQRWVSRGIPSECVRAKGFVTFAEEPGVPYDFHMSGRRRVEIEPSADRGGPAALATGFKAKSTANAKAATRLVLIGPEIDQNAARAALEALETPPVCEAADVAGALERARELVGLDQRLEWVEAGGWCHPSAADTCAHFRLTGAEANGLTVDEMERNHGVDMNAMNRDLVRALNSGGDGVVVTAATRDDAVTYFGAPEVCVRVSLVGAEECGVLGEKWWDRVRTACTTALRRHIAHIPKCKCGF